MHGLWQRDSLQTKCNRKLNIIGLLSFALRTFLKYYSIFRVWMQSVFASEFLILTFFSSKFCISSGFISPLIYPLVSFLNLHCLIIRMASIYCDKIIIMYARNIVTVESELREKCHLPLSSIIRISVRLVTCCASVCVKLDIY